MTQKVSLSKSGFIAELEFADAKANCLSSALLAELASQLEQLRGDDSLRVVVLRSAGDGAFCAGASKDELGALKNEAEGEQFFLGFARLYEAMLRLDKFIVVRVQGKVAGGGLGLVAGADYAVAHSGAEITLPELSLGIAPFVVSPVLERKLSQNALTALVLEAGWKSALWAKEQGLYTVVHDSKASMDAAVREIALKVSGFKPEALSEFRRCLWRGTEDFGALLRARARISGRLAVSK